MSIRAMHYVWEHSTTTGSQRLMLLAIADAANDEGICFPGVGTLAEKVNTTERNAQKMLRALAAAGEITIHDGKGIKTAHGWTNRYNMTFCGVSISTPRAKSVSKMTPQEVNVATPQEVSETTPKPSVEPSVEPKEREEAAPIPEPVAPAPEMPLSLSKPEPETPSDVPIARDVTTTPMSVIRQLHGDLPPRAEFNDTAALMTQTAKALPLLTAYAEGFPLDIRPKPANLKAYEKCAAAMADAGVTPAQVTAKTKALIEAGETKINIWRVDDALDEDKLRAYQVANGITKTNGSASAQHIGDAYRKIAPGQYHADGSPIYEDEKANLEKK